MVRSWPSPSDYSAAIQNPRNCLTDPDLQRGSVGTDALGLPLVASGNFAVVYQLQTGRSLYAIRCFIRPVTDQQERYDLLSRHLAGLWLPWLVDFAYLEQGIRLRGQEYPVVKMEWAPGNQLHRYVEGQLRQSKALVRLAAEFRGLVGALRGARTAHGDLQQGNILIDGHGHIQLIDYDGMFIPRLRGRPPGEVGHPNYQHPERIRSGYYEASADDFSALVIYLSLLALSADSSLWAFHNGDNLILAEGDFNKPGATPIWHRLRQNPLPDVRRLADNLATFCTGPVANVLDLEAVLQGSPPPPPPPSPPPTPGTVVGSVRSPAGQPIPGATVRVGAWHGNADPRGAFRTAGLPAGPQQVTATAAGYADFAGSVNVVAGTSVPLAITLQPTLLWDTRQMFAASCAVLGALVGLLLNAPYLPLLAVLFATGLAYKRLGSSVRRVRGVDVDWKRVALVGASAAILGAYVSPQATAALGGGVLGGIGGWFGYEPLLRRAWPWMRGAATGWKATIPQHTWKHLKIGISALAVLTLIARAGSMVADFMRGAPGPLASPPPRPSIATPHSPTQGSKVPVPGTVRLGSKPFPANVYRAHSLSWLGQTGQTPLVLKLPAGRHELLVRKNQFLPERIVVNLQEGEVRDLTVNLRAAGTAASPTRTPPPIPLPPRSTPPPIPLPPP